MEGKNIVIEWRSAEGKLDRLPALAAELVRLKVDVIVTGGPTPTRAAKEATSRFPLSWQLIPILLANGFVASLARPGGNITGLSTPCPGAKRKATGASEGDRSQALARGGPRDFDPPGQRTSVKRDGTRRRGVRGAASIPRRTKFPRILRPHSEPQARGGLTQSSCWRARVFNSHRKQIVDLAAKSRLPAIFIAPGICGGRGAYVLRREHYRLVSGAPLRMWTRF